MDSIRKGDTYNLQVHFDDYPASLYSAVLSIVNVNNCYTATATASVDDFIFTIADTSTGLYEAGDYTYYVRVSYSGDVHTAQVGTIKILPNITTAIDTRSQAKRNLDALNAVYEGRATRSDLSYTVAGRTLQSFSPKQLRDEISYWTGIYMMELRQEKIDRGEQSSSHIYVRL